MTIKVHDSQTVQIDVVDGKREEVRVSQRRVMLGRDDIPGLPESLTENGGIRRRTMTFQPQRITIVYKPTNRLDGEFGFDEVSVYGQNIRKDGSLGEQTGYNRYWLMPEEDEDEWNERLIMHRAADFRVPDYLVDLVRKYDPFGTEHPFAATERVLA